MFFKQVKPPVCLCLSLSDSTHHSVCLFYLEAELVHGVDLVEIVHDEVEQRGSDSDGPIVLSGLVDLHFIHFGFQDLRQADGYLTVSREQTRNYLRQNHLHLDLSCSVLGGLQLLHQHVVTQEVALSGRQPGQQLVLQQLQLDLEHVLLFGQITLQRETVSHCKLNHYIVSQYKIDR